MLLNTDNGQITFAETAERDAFYAEYGGASIIPAYLCEANKQYLKLEKANIVIGRKDAKQLVVVVGQHESVPLHYEITQLGTETKFFSWARFAEAKACLNGKLIKPANVKQAPKQSDNPLINEAMAYIAANMQAPLCISAVRLARLLEADGEEAFEGHYHRHCQWWNNHRAKQLGVK